MNRTPLYQRHLDLKGKMVDFSGWELPVQYTSIKEEHLAVRSKAGVFDISHMGQVMVEGPDAFAYLQRLVTNDVAKAVEGKGIYAHLLNEKGGVIDDIFVYRLDEEKFLVIVNASRRETDLAWMNRHTAGFSVNVMEIPFAAAFALQGPLSAQIAGALSADIPSLSRFHISDIEIGDVSALVARTGYTGEDGFEFFAPAGHILLIFDQLLKVGVPLGLLPCGLGARDTLRTEVAYPLYGHELDENHTPFEAGLDWVVKLEKGDFIGRSALQKQKAEGLRAKLAGFRIESGGVARPGAEILIGSRPVGTVASGTFSPTLNVAIGMAYLPVEHAGTGTALGIRQGARESTAVTVPLPFYRKPAVASV